jgi:bacitracin synthase 3
VEAGLVTTEAGLHPEPPVALRLSQYGIGLSFLSKRYSRTLADQFSRHYCKAANFLVADPLAPLCRLNLVSSAEREQLFKFNGTAREYAGSKSLHCLVEEQVLRTPRSTAVVYEKVRLTYAELNEKANRLAAFLCEEPGVATGEAVGLMVRRSEMMVVAMLGILKSGACYVPIDPMHPQEIVSYIIGNTGIRILVVDSDTTAKAAFFDGELFILDTDFPMLEPGIPNLPVDTSGEDLAYIIYTSGSTGRPKGVAVEHRAIVNTIQWRIEYHCMDEYDATLQMPSYAFDSSVEDIFCSLVSGGKLVIPETNLRLDAQYIRRTIEAECISRFLVTPSYYTRLIPELGGISGIRSVTVAGEKVSLALVNEHHNHLPGIRLVNEYGPTENAVCSTACDLGPDIRAVQIGRPIANTQVFVLDSSQMLVPIGVPGEVYLAGMGLARGYINQPILTAERFLSSPFSEFPGRMYRTGDWARWTTEGTLEFLGRLDNQVKVRGFRIELNHVEQVLMQHPDVKMASVLCKENQAGNGYLVAYIASPMSISSNELSNWLKTRLPYYMVPEIFHVFLELPLTLNGKIDTQALRELTDFEVAEPSGEKPGTPLQESLVQIISPILQRRRIGLDESFFAVGASSLKIFEIVRRIRDELELHFELADIYACPTIRELANKLVEQET